MFPLPISTYLYIAIALGTAFITHRVDGYYSEKEKLEAIQHVVEVQTKVVNDQAVISQKTQKDKDDLQTKYDSAIADLRGVRQHSSTTDNQPTTPAISSQGLRLLEPDAEVLIGFARQCEATEIERNDVINKYNALMVSK
jgi:hypothetical protein